MAHNLIMHVIEYIYSAHSAFAYLGSKRLLQICADYRVKLIHKPVILSPVVESQGSLPFGARTQSHVDYFFGREIERWAEYRNVPVINFRPTRHDADYSVASGIILALGDTGSQVDNMAHNILKAHWCDDADLSDLETLERLASDLGHDAGSLMKQAQSDEIQEQLRENSDWAKKRNVFGSPTYIVNGDPFYGQDHLEILEHALHKPFASTTWVNPLVN